MSGPFLSITADSNGFRRAGMAFGLTAVVVDPRELGEDVVKALMSEPRLTVRPASELTSTPAEPLNSSSADQINDLIERYQGDIDALNEELGEARANLVTAEDEISRLKSDLASSATAFAELEARLAGVQEQLSAAQTQSDSPGGEPEKSTPRPKK